MGGYEEAISFVAKQNRESTDVLNRRHEGASCAKIAELRKILEQAGYHSLSEQAVVLRLSRSTTWALLLSNARANIISKHSDKRKSLSSVTSLTSREWNQPGALEASIMSLTII